MSIENEYKVDGIGVSRDGDKIILLISDHLTWENEYSHLILLQKKINAYLTFWENKQYEEIYPGKTFHYAVIEIHFKYPITENCTRFLYVAGKQIEPLGITITSVCS